MITATIDHARIVDVALALTGDGFAAFSERLVSYALPPGDDLTITFQHEEPLTGTLRFYLDRLDAGTMDAKRADAGPAARMWRAALGLRNET